MKNDLHMPRRKWLKLGFGLAAGTLGSGYLLSKNAGTADHCDPTLRQELGPFPPMKFRLQADHDVDLTKIAGQGGRAAGEVIVAHGKILDTDCKPLEGAIVEIWQANHFGKYHHEFDKDGQDDPFFQGWGQAVTNANGEYRFTTVVPGLYDQRTRHIHFKVSKRGYHELTTQLYFDGEERNNTDGILNSFTHEEQQRVIRKLNKTTSQPSIEFDIVIQQVMKDGIPEKVLAEYNGNYELQYKGTPHEGFINELLGGPYEKVVMNVENDGSLLYFTLPFAPKSEIFWKAKDRFDAGSFFRAELQFLRDATGKVSGFAFKWEGEQDLSGTKV